MRRLIAVVFVTSVLAGCADDATPSSSRAAGSADAECGPELRTGFDAWADAGFSGTIAISTGGRLDCSLAYGHADQDEGRRNTVDTVFSIGSISKSFTAAAILDLVDQGSLSLNARAGDVVPDLSGPAASVTVEELLLHTSGLTGSIGEDHEPLSREQAIAHLGRLEQAFEPGSDYLYSNAGYTLLALIVQEVSGRSYREQLASRLLGSTPSAGFWDGEPSPSGPRAIGYLADGRAGEDGDFAGPHWALDGNGSLAMTTADLAAWTHELFDGELVSDDSVARIATPGFDHGDGSGETFGWVRFDETRFGEPVVAAAGGGGDVGHDAVVAWLPDSDRVVAIASNTPTVTAEDLLRAVGPALVAGDPLPPPSTSATLPGDPAALDEAAGTYDLATGGRFDVAVEESGLSITAGDSDALAVLFPLPDDITDERVTSHEEAVRSLLAGETAPGREELELLEEDLGAVEGVDITGTLVVDGELRTYVVLTTPAGPVDAWYALDDAGGIAAVELTDTPPHLAVVAQRDGGYGPVDPTGAGPEVHVTFEDETMTITGPHGTIEATRRS